MLVFHLPVTASQGSSSSHIQQELNHVSVQVACMLFCSVFLLFAQIYFPSPTISKAEVLEWSKVPSTCSLSISGAQCLDQWLRGLSLSAHFWVWDPNRKLTPSPVIYSLSYYFPKIPASPGGIKPPTFQLTAKQAMIAPHRTHTEGMHLLTNFTFPHSLTTGRNILQWTNSVQLIQFRSKM